MLNIDDILNSDDINKELVKVPEWGGDVYVKTMSGSEKDAYEVGLQITVDGEIKPDLTMIRARLAASTMCNEAGERICPVDKIAELSAKSSIALDRVVDVSQRLNGMSAKELEEIEKNLDTGQSEDSISV